MGDAELDELRSRYLAGDLVAEDADFLRYWQLEHESARLAREAQKCAAEERVATMTRTRAEVVEAKAGADEPMSREEGLDWAAMVIVSRPDRVEEFDHWYATPISDILFARLPTLIHMPARHESRPRGRRPRGRRRTRAPAGRQEDDEPEPEVADLRAISPEEFARALEAAGL